MDAKWICLRASQNVVTYYHMLNVLISMRQHICTTNNCKKFNSCKTKRFRLQKLFATTLRTLRQRPENCPTSIARSRQDGEMDGRRRRASVFRTFRCGRRRYHRLALSCLSSVSVLRSTWGIPRSGTFSSPKHRQPHTSHIMLYRIRCSGEETRQCGCIQFTMTFTSLRTNR